jgi:hypothetical protein
MVFDAYLAAIGDFGAYDLYCGNQHTQRDVIKQKITSNIEFKKFILVNSFLI